MRRDFFINNWQIILFNSVLLFCFILFYGQFGSIFVDCFREAYIPEQMLKGQILYKNIFCIYPPFAYIFNSILFKIFGTNLNVLYISGLLSSALILNLSYKISTKFLPKLYALTIVFFSLVALILSPNVFNTIFPYSFGMVYGLVFALFSIYFALNKKFPIAYLMYSLAICSKYEFLLLLPALLYISKKKDLIKNIIAVALPIIFTLTALLLSGLTLDDLVNQMYVIFDISSSKTLHYYYSISGILFSPKLLLIYLINFVKIIIPILLLYQYRNLYSILAVAIYFVYFATPDILIYLFPLILVLLIIEYKNLNQKKKFLAFSTLLISAKNFFALLIKSYGVYYIPLAVLSLLILVSKRVKKVLLIILIILTFIFGISNIINLNIKNQKITSSRGTVYTSNIYSNSINKLNKYIINYTKSTDIICVFPEMTSINFLTNRSSDNKLYSLIPMYVESFGEDAIIKRINITKPNYIVISKYDTSDYYYKYFGEDYAIKVLNYIKDNYIEVNEFMGDSFFSVYKLR